MFSLSACLERRERFPMPARIPFSHMLVRVTSSAIALALFSLPLWGQKPSQKPSGVSPNAPQQNPGSEVDVSVRDSVGGPLNVPAVVRLYSMTSSYNVSASTRDASTAYFQNVLPGEYELEVTSLGYRKTTEHLSLVGNGARLPVYVNMLPESDSPKPAEPSHGVVMTPQLRSQMQKGLEALNKKQYEAAKAIFTKSLQKAPGNPDIVYFLGVAELGLQHLDLARENFQHAVSLDPNHEMALVSLGELQLKNGTAAEAIITL